MPVITSAQAGGANRCAFLQMITWSEIGEALIENPITDRGYKTLVGATPAHPLVFTDYSKPPNVFNAAMNSTAAGAYQCLHKYAVSYIASLGLPDFGPLSQDRIALQLIRECRALPFIDAGSITKAITMCASRWASLPGSSYLQRTHTVTDLLQAYAAAGGVLA
jgi:muramidase (phage lysozyme)